MKCPRCINWNAPGAKFCSDCGQRTGDLCSYCDTLNLPQSNFCHQCGKFLPKTNALFSDAKSSRPCLPYIQKATLPRAFTGERKYITVLFSDLSGYKTLVQRPDAEEVKGIAARLSREITKVFTTYEGFIEKYIGDVVMAFFGAIRAHEDNPILAIRSAREVHELISNLSSHYETQIGQTLAMHKCINTDLVVTGEVDFDKSTYGIAEAMLNLTARLCSLVTPLFILVGPDTYRQRIGYFNFYSQEQVQLKNMTAPIRVFKVISRINEPKKAHRFRGLRADLIGRNPELNLLKKALDSVRAAKDRFVLLGAFKIFAYRYGLSSY